MRILAERHSDVISFRLQYTPDDNDWELSMQHQHPFFRRWAIRGMYARDEQSTDWARICGNGAVTLHKGPDTSSGKASLTVRESMGCTEIHLSPLALLQNGAKVALRCPGDVNYFVVMLWSESSAAAFVHAMQDGQGTSEDC